MKKIILASLLLLSVLLIAQPSSWKITGVGGGGALFLPSINPGNTNEFYVPTDMGTIFHTTNYGQTYDQLSFLQLRGGKNAVVRFTTNANILYAVGGDGAVSKSINGGTSWSVIPAISGSTDPDVTQSVVSLYTNYNNPNQLVFATVDGMFFFK